ncbi:MAG TPA: hypothetical protein VGN17_25750 [Bryobacteraceae bacterium]
MSSAIMGLARLAWGSVLAMGPLFAQPAATPADPVADFKVAENMKTVNYPQTLSDITANFRRPFLEYVRAKSLQQNAFDATFGTFLRGVENGRVDEQAGSSATAGGTASAAEKAGITGLVTAALESGALTQTLDQNLLTVRGNGEGLFRFLTGQDVLPICMDSSTANCDPSPLNNLELTAAFDVSKSNTQAVTGQNPADGTSLAALLTSDKRQFSSAGARFVIKNTRDLRSKTYRDAWNMWFLQNKTALFTATSDLLTAQDSIYTIVRSTDANGKTVAFDDPTSVYQMWRAGAVTALKAAPANAPAVSAVLVIQLDLLEAAMRKSIPDLDAKLTAAGNAYGRYYANTRAGFDLGNQPMLTVEISYQEPSLQPKLINSKIVFAWSPKQKGTVNPGTLTINAGLSNYTKAQVSNTKGNTSYWRDAQFALQFDRPVDSKALSTFTLGAYIQYQISPGLINIPSGTVAPGTSIPLPGNATQLLAKRGTVAVLQAAMTLQLPNSGIKLPIGISWSNRTELLTGNEVRGHIGFSFDTHSLLLAGK